MYGVVGSPLHCGNEPLMRSVFQICMPYRIVGWPSEQSVGSERNFAHRVAQ